MTVGQARDFRRGQRLVIGVGQPDEEHVRIVRRDGGTLTVTRWRWWHTALARPGIWRIRFRWWLDGRIVAWEDWRDARRQDGRHGR